MDGLIIRELLVRYFRGARKVTVYNAGVGVIEVSGINGAGKSSLLESIPALLAGARQWDGDSLTHGAIKGQITAVLSALEAGEDVEMDGITITRRFNEGNQSRGGSLLIKTASGEKMGQRDLSKLFIDLSFDPMAFCRMRAEDQVTSLQALAGADFVAELAELDRDIDVAEEERRETGRDIKRFGTIPDVPKVEPVDTAELLRELQKVERANDTIASALRDVNMQSGLVATRGKRIDELKKALADAEDELAVTVSERDRAKRTVEELGAQRDTSELQQALAAAGERNAQHEAWKRAEAERAKLTALTRRALGYDQQIEDLREQRRQKSLSAKLPIDGLEWGAKGVTLRGLPFLKLSSSERLRLSVRIGMASHPALRVMLLQDGDRLDDASFEELRALAVEHRYQIWVESVRGARTDDAMEIVDGEYGAVDPWTAEEGAEEGAE